MELASITARPVATLAIERAENSQMVLALFVREGMIEKKKGKKEMKGKINRINWSKLTPKLVLKELDAHTDCLPQQWH